MSMCRFSPVIYYNQLQCSAKHYKVVSVEKSILDLLSNVFQTGVDPSQRCAFWDTVSGLDPGWSTAGVMTVRTRSDTIVCYSRHLTNFAVIAVWLSQSFIMMC